MKMTRFFKLRKALAELDVNFVAKKIAHLEDRLTKHGQPFDPENTAVTQEGIYYIHPESGMTARVVLYDSDHRLKVDSAPKKELYLTGYTEAKVISKLHPYHLVRCNALTEAEKSGWPKPMRVAQRSDGSFYYRFINKPKSGKSSEDDVYQEIENQRLFICENCFMKVNSLLEGVAGIKRESFHVRYFFDVDFFGSWCRYGENFKATESLANMYPKDWQEITRIRTEQTQHHCESCNIDLSDYRLRKFLHVQAIDHVKQKIAYVKLQCMCIGCLVDHPARAHLKNHPDYAEYMTFLGNGSLKPEEHEEEYTPTENPSVVLSQIMSRPKYDGLDT